MCTFTSTANDMTQTINYRGTSINKVHISDVQDELENKGLNINELFGEEDDYCYVSCGFMRGLCASENTPGEWHHYFKKDGADFSAFKMNFC